MVKVIETLAEFQQTLQSAGDKLVVVDFYADWCGPCRMIAPKIVEMENELAGGVLFYKVNVDDNEETAQKQGISAMPTFQFFKKGDKVAELTGANEAKLKDLIEKNK